MKTIEYQKIIKSLCAVFLSCSMISSFFAKPILAAETTASDITTTESVAEESTIVETTVETTMEIPVETTTAEEITTEITTEESTTVEILVETTTEIPVETTTAEEITTETTTEESTTVETIVETIVETMSEGIPTEETATGPYKYNITIEFGALQFYYDWGEWSPREHQYRADVSSSNPAAGTTGGLPGWYGFDGTNNCIKVINNSGGKVVVKLSFDMTKDEKYSNANADMYDVLKQNITMSVYKNYYKNYANNTFSGEVPKARQNQYEFNLLANQTEEWYLSFSGEPFRLDGTKFQSPTPKAIGFLTIKVELPAQSRAESTASELLDETTAGEETTVPEETTTAEEMTTVEETTTAPFVIDGGLDS